MNQHLIFNENIKSFDLNNIFKYVEGKYGVSTLNSIREYLKLSKRIEKCKTDIYFINSCLQNNIMPIIRNVKLESSIERDIQKYLKKPNNKNFKK